MLRPALNESFLSFRQVVFLFRTIDPAGKESRVYVDALGRTIKTVDNFKVENASELNPSDVTAVVEYKNHASGQVSTMTVKDPVTGDQISRDMFTEAAKTASLRFSR